MIDAVIFDMDGLLVDSEPVWFRARVDLMEQHGTTWTDADQRAMAGVHTNAWVEALGRKLDGALAPRQVFEEIVGRMRGYYERGEIALLPGASDAVAELLGARAHNIAFTENATASYIQALSSIPFERDDVILTGRAQALGGCPGVRDFGWIFEILNFIRLDLRYSVNLSVLSEDIIGFLEISEALLWHGSCFLKFQRRRAPVRVERLRGAEASLDSTTMHGGLEA